MTEESLPIQQLTLTTQQIVNLCKFAGIAINYPDSSFSDDSEQLETEYIVAQNDHGLLTWLQEYPEEGVFPLGGEDWKLYSCTNDSGKDEIIDTGSEPYILDQLHRRIKDGHSVWAVKPDGAKVLPEDISSCTDNAQYIAKKKLKMTGLYWIAKERKDHTEKHGYTPEHDDAYTNGELTRGAMFCLTLNGDYWPCDWDTAIRNHIRTKSEADRHAIAGSFCAAEIDRIKRAINNQVASNSQEELDEISAIEAEQRRQDEADKKVLLMVKEMVSLQDFTSIEEEIRECSDVSDLMLVDKPCGDEQCEEYEHGFRYVDQTCNGGFTGDQYAGYVYIPVAKDKWLRFAYWM